jgi:hypothetical protein
VPSIRPIDPGDHHIDSRTDGRFDLLHIGHLDLLQRLRATDDVRWSVLGTVRKSVTTSTMPTSRASIRFMAILGNSSGSSSFAAGSAPIVTSRDALPGERRP